jgi:hypothetical protein
MGLIGDWDQIYPDYQVQNFSFIPYWTLKLIQYLGIISGLLESVCLYSEVMPLSNFHCSYNILFQRFSWSNKR